MRLAVIFLLLAIVALALLYFTGFIQVTPDAVNMNIGSTAVATTYTSFAVLTVWIVGMLFALAGLIGSGFRKGLFWILLLVFAVAGGVIFYLYIYK